MDELHGMPGDVRQQGREVREDHVQRGLRLPHWPVFGRGQVRHRRKVLLLLQQRELLERNVDQERLQLLVSLLISCTFAFSMFKFVHQLCFLCL